MPESSQWTDTEVESRSATVRAKLLVPSGGSVHRSGGDTSEPSQVCLTGMSPPGPKAGLRSLNAMADAPSPYDTPTRVTEVTGDRGSSRSGLTELSKR